MVSFLKKLEQKFIGNHEIWIPQRNLVSIRMEAIGGQGANSAGKIIAESAVLGMNYNGNHFSSFGSEKRGSPVTSFVRFATNGSPVRTASFIKNPDILVIFHESMITSIPEILSGVSENTDIIINTDKNISEIQIPFEFKFRYLVSISATKLALKLDCGINAVMMGALSRLVPEIESEKIEVALQNFFKSSKEKVIQANLKGFQEGRKSIYFSKIHESDLKKNIAPINRLPPMGWANAPVGGTIINPGNSILKDHSASRKGSAPLFNNEICCHCGYCDMICPDFCFVWEKSLLKGIDYQYCKGCQKCIEICPVGALTLTEEEKIPDDAKQIHRFPEAKKTF